MKKVKRALFTMAALVALAGMALATGCEKKQGGTGGSTGGSTTGGSYGGGTREQAPGTSHVPGTVAPGGGMSRYSSSR